MAFRGLSRQIFALKNGLRDQFLCLCLVFFFAIIFKLYKERRFSDGQKQIPFHSSRRVAFIACRLRERQQLLIRRVRKLNLGESEFVERRKLFSETNLRRAGLPTQR
jgi:hypothetical protein